MSERKSCTEIFKTGGGYYGELREAVDAEELEGWVEAHHIPSREAIEASKLYWKNGGKLDEGNPPAILMDYNDHRLTASCPGNPGAAEYRQKQADLIKAGKFIEAQKMDIDDIHSKFGNKYDHYIEQAIKHTKNIQKDGFLETSRGKNPSGIRINKVPFKPILIIAAIILLILFLLSLLRNCGSSGGGSAGGGTGTIGGSTGITGEGTGTINGSGGTTGGGGEIISGGGGTISGTPVFTEKTEALFIANSSELLPPASSWLDVVANELVQYIALNPNAKFKVIGYCAVVPGLPDPNELSRERADKIVKELINRNIEASRLQPEPGGETEDWTEHLGYDYNEADIAPNRRIYIEENKQ
jgi:outer membrane protein OmpA-like peptidoglycan-associated protein